MIRVDNVTKIFKTKNFFIYANKEISLNIKKGELFGLFGPNGSGKTTLVRQILGLLDPTSGTIYINGIEVEKNKQKIKELIGYMSQSSYAVLWSLTVKEALLISGQLKGLSKEEILKTFNYYKEYFELGNIDNYLVGQLSGGMRRIVNFIISVLGVRPVLILDEPTNELDPYKRKLLWNKVKELNSAGVTVILITHNVLEAEEVVNRVAIMLDGKILISGDPGNLVKNFEDKIRLELFVLDTNNKTMLRSDEFISKFPLIEEKSEKLVFLCPKKSLGEIMEWLQKHEQTIQSYNFSRVTLEEVYFKIFSQQKGA
ncbi:hypothetical protein BBF96_09730 [Anoxybacter fermentans]|uniref:ABC transporter domain-containing protein n=1 Tax=Anoxybacter fermentans TaxID=1323375 RepID=A0A3S9SZQ0_9FIRM|nr:ABC transporter ATP-binding protein [Anoxybacter fermentans]AZR73642.1 hypothetical protein BBF96_09730 [Anoxybacter fermentans]